MSALLSSISGFALQQNIAAFALHALWQVPVLAGAAALAIRIGRPHVRVAHVMWVTTLALCVLAPAVATVTGHRAAVEAARGSAEVSITYDSSVKIIDLLPMQRQPAWKLALRRHVLSPAPFAFTLTPRVARSITWVYLAVAFAFATRLFLSWRRTRLLVRASATQNVPWVIAQALQRQCDAMGCVPPQAAMTTDLPGPALAGVLQPTLLLPADTVAEMSSAEIDAVLAHELAHLRRGDPALHAACCLLLLPVSFHPAAIWAGRRVRQTREMACDAEAAERLGSTAGYAHALLQVAERSGGLGSAGAGLGLFGMGLFGLGLFDGDVLPKASIRDGLLRQGRGPTTVGLQLFGMAGAMEERLQTMMKSKPSENGAKRVARTVAAASLAAVAVVAAAMIQVQPTLAHAQDAAPQAASRSSDAPSQGDKLPVLIGGDHAREQLRSARHQLAEAEKSSTSDLERKRLAAAQDVITMAEQELAIASGHDHPDFKFDLRGFHVDPELAGNMEALRANAEKQRAAAERIRAQVDSPEFKAWVERQKAEADRIRAEVDSPEFKTRIAKDRAEADRIGAVVNSPAFKQQLEKQRAEADRIRAEVNTPEFKARIEKQRAEADRLRDEYNSPAFKARIEKQRADAERMRAQFDSPAFKAQMEAERKQWERVIQGMAHNEMPPLPGFAPAPVQSAGKPVKVEGGILAGQIITKTQPRYPQSAKDAHISGSVVLHAIIDETGKVEQLAVVSSPDKALSESAIEAVRQWVYKPYLLNGNPTSVDTTITVTYSLEENPSRPGGAKVMEEHPKILTRIDPVIPAEVRQRFYDVPGKVTLLVQVGTSGKVDSIQTVSSPDQMLANAAIEAVRQWTFEPTTRNGLPVAVNVPIHVTYQR